MHKQEFHLIKNFNYFGFMNLLNCKIHFEVSEDKRIRTAVLLIH